MGDGKKSELLRRILYLSAVIKYRLLRLEEYDCVRPYPEILLERGLLVELSYVQIRKILELTMYISVAAHEISEIELSRKIRDGWHAQRIMAWLRDISPEYFPCPIDILPPEDEDKVEGRWVDASKKRPCLNPSLLNEYYNAAGELLHESSLAINEERIIKYYQKSRIFVDLAKNLFTYFSIEPNTPAGHCVVGTFHFEHPNRPPEVVYAKASDT